MKIAIRPLEDGDVPAVAALLAAEGFGTDCLERLRAEAATLRRFSLVARSDRDVKGALLATFNGWHVFASHWVVAPAARRQGIGRQLIDALTVRAARAGARGIVADARASAVATFVRLGFRHPGATFLIRDVGR